MKIDIVTLFPQMLEGPMSESLLGKARTRGDLTISIHDLRLYTHDRHRTADDAPYGGGEGMVMKPEPIFRVIEALKTDETTVVLPSPQGIVFTQQVAEELLAKKHLLFLCGHYEGVDDRVRSHGVDLEISLGDFITSGGEFPALIMIDVIARLVPGVVGNRDSVVNETFSSGILDYPSWTRPAEFRGLLVPDVLQSGHHMNIERWRRKEALRRTLIFRPDLLTQDQLSKEDHRLLREIEHEMHEVIDSVNG